MQSLQELKSGSQLSKKRGKVIIKLSRYQKLNTVEVISPRNNELLSRTRQSIKDKVKVQLDLSNYCT